MKKNNKKNKLKQIMWDVQTLADIQLKLSVARFHLNCISH